MTAASLSVTASGAITDSGSQVISGATTLNTGNNSTIALNDAGNNFNSVAVTSTGDTVILVDSDSIDLAGMTAASLSVTANGAITDSGSQVISGATTLNSGNNSTIALNDAGNNFNSVAVTSTGDTVILVDSDSIDLAGMTAASLSVTASGAITDSGTLAITGTTTINAGANNITIDNGDRHLRYPGD